MLSLLWNLTLYSYFIVRYFRNEPLPGRKYGPCTTIQFLLIMLDRAWAALDLSLFALMPSGRKLTVFASFFGLLCFSALVPSTGERVNYPTRPVDTTTDIEGTTSLQPSQPVGLFYHSYNGIFVMQPLFSWLFVQQFPLFLSAAIIRKCCLREHGRCSSCYGEQRHSTWAYANGWNSKDARPWDCHLWPSITSWYGWRDEP